MAKRRHEEVRTEGSKATMAIMAVGGLLVAGLVVWALTRTVQPAPSSTNVPMTVEQPATATTTFGDVTAAGTNPSITPSGATLPPIDATAQGTQATSTYQPNPPSADENATVARISVADLKARLDAKQITLVDVRQDTAFVTSHIPGAMHMAMATVEANLASLPKDKPIVTYCT